MLKYCAKCGHYYETHKPTLLQMSCSCLPNEVFEKTLERAATIEQITRAAWEAQNKPVRCLGDLNYGGAQHG